jgi:two-component system chemotaxis response regulator CheB
MAIGDHPAAAGGSRIVVAAASAGGIGALSTLLRGLPTDFPAPIVVVQHRRPFTQSLLPAILQRSSPLPVVEARPGAVCAPGFVYLARPELHLSVTRQGRFAYSDGRRIRHLLSSANPLFESAASAFGPGAVAVVLTGTGMDGTDGVQAIRAAGGIVIAQDERTSQYFGMPRSAIRSGVVDYVLPIEQVAPALVRLVTNQSLPVTIG